MRASLSALLALLCCASSLRAGEYTVCSQNTLHLGYSSSNGNKVRALRDQFESCHMVLLQEVMRRSLIRKGKLPEGALFAVMPGNPGDYYVAHTDLRGHTSYKESYAWIIRNDMEAYPNSAAGTDPHSPSGSLAKRFTRNPGGIVAHHTADAGPNYVWFVNYHAIFGKRVDERRREVKAMPEIVEFFQSTTFGNAQTDNVLIGGDWNLDADDGAYEGLEDAGFTILPNVKTSLTTKGDPSAPYDHFAYNAGVKVVGKPSVIRPASRRTWRKQVSDHMGIQCTVHY